MEVGDYSDPIIGDEKGRAEGRIVLREKSSKYLTTWPYALQVADVTWIEFSSSSSVTMREVNSRVIRTLREVSLVASEKKNRSI